MITKNKSKSAIPAVIITVAVFVSFAAFVLIMLNNAVETSGEEALRAARDSVMRAVASCYAYEGMYPNSIEYLEENYNLVINRSKYIVFYDKIADNLLPNIIVTERGAS
ncbi:MAG: hypothetical protein FWG70_03750 [Oscillospiraceae bacterium]|nr:hypothetical protein [Oscillospiraceae bacterium]